MKVGDKVICIQSHSSGDIIKGREYTIIEIQQRCDCIIAFDVGVKTIKRIRCPKCKIRYPEDGILWAGSELFALKTFVKFMYEIKIEGELSRREADLIWEHAAFHPEIKQYTEQGSFLFPFMNIFKDQDIKTEFKFREIDLMLKALEYPIQTDKKLRHIVRQKLISWCDAINVESQKINK